MKAVNIQKVCVVGAGNMGHQISTLAAMHGCRVGCVDSSSEQLKKAEAFVDTYLPARVAKGKLTEDEAVKIRSNLTFTTSLEEGAAEADFAIEAVTELLDLKKDIFCKLDQIMPAHAVITTNSSFFVSSRLAGSIDRPDRVCNMHFFNPALVMKCVEVVKGPHTADDTAELTMDFARRLGKVPVLLKKEVYGFLVNRILAAINNEALFLLDTGVASEEDIDSAITNALGHPLGPFSLMDLTGIDLSYHICMERYRETGDASEKPSPTVVEKYVKGEWGKKTGVGFYRYND